ncbi:MAG: vWA domain-containing protein [Nanoarchaeota archaeon]
MKKFILLLILVSFLLVSCDGASIFEIKRFGPVIVIDLNPFFIDELRSEESKRIIVRVIMASQPGPLTIYTLEDTPQIIRYTDATSLTSETILEDVFNGKEHPPTQNVDYGSLFESISRDRLPDTPFLLVGLVHGGSVSANYDDIVYSINDIYNSGPTRMIFLGLSRIDLIGTQTVFDSWRDVFEAAEAVDLYTFPSDGRGYYLSTSVDLSSELLTYPSGSTRRNFPVVIEREEIIEPELKATERSSINLVVMLDVSGSFRTFLPEAKESLSEMVISLRENDFITILTVDDSIDVVVSRMITNPIRDIIDIRDLVETITPSRDRGTDVVGGFMWSVNYLQTHDTGNDQGKILVCVTDGEPDYHPLSPEIANGWSAPSVLHDTELYIVGYNNDMTELSMHTLLHNENLSYSESPLSGFGGLLETFREELSIRPPAEGGDE